ncbi:MAG: aminotransferase class I/II-fold pyridoxal phosphate-dependent enzyme [Flexilinea sp.]|nr:aminotransferase class I/II-fold pyridoxal phosphate-dependent enzyme [Flexilinea sp.]
MDFSSSINPLGTPPAVLQALRDAVPLSIHYPDPYCRKAAAAISAYEGVPDGSVLLGNGAAELIYAFCSAAAPRKALIPVPAFSEYESALRNCGSEVLYHKLLPEKDFLLDETFLQAIRTGKPEAVFLCHPNNPTGRLIPKELLDEIISLCEFSGIHLFLDACFLDLTGTAADLNSRLAGNPHLFILKALTKSFGLPGLRVGYCLSSDSALLAAMARSVQPWNVSVPAQAAVPAALRETGWLADSIRLIENEREYLTEALITLGFSVCPSDVNFILFRGPEGFDTALRKQGIAIRNCGNFPGLGPGWYRVSVRIHEENEALISALQGLVTGD